MTETQIYQPKSLLLQWHITERCNIRCTHCYQKGVSKELNLAKLLTILEQYKVLLQEWQQHGLVRGHITVTGGEPFIRRDFLELLAEFARHKELFTFAILCNGTFIDEAMAQHLQQLGVRFVQVSMEGGPTTHDDIRGEGSFKQTVTAIKYLVKANIKTYISFTAHQANYREFGEVARLGVELKVARVWADRLIPQGSGSKLQPLTPSETVEFFNIMEQSRQAAQPKWFQVWSTACTDIAMNRALQFLVGGGRPYHCTAGDTLITVMPNGDLYPCRRMPIRVGNVLETPLNELYHCDLFQSLRHPEQTGAGCHSCLHSNSCRGGLRCLSFATTGDPFQTDPGCSHKSTEFVTEVKTFPTASPRSSPIILREGIT